MVHMIPDIILCTLIISRLLYWHGLNLLLNVIAILHLVKHCCSIHGVLLV